MNKKILALALLAAIGLGLSSCKSKKSDEPQIVNPNPNNGGNNGGGNSGSVLPSVNPTAPNTALVFKLAEGKTVQINDKTYTAGANQGYVGIDQVELAGKNKNALTIKADDLEELIVAKPIPGMTTLTFESTGLHANRPLNRIDLSGATSLRSLKVAGVETEELDVTKLTGLAQLIIGDQQSKNTDIKKVKWATNNKIQILNISSSPFTDGNIDLDNLPALRTCRLTTTRLSQISLKRSPELTTLVIDKPVGGHGTPFSLDLTNNTKLQDLMMRDVRITTLTIKDNQVLDTSKSNLDNAYAENLNLSGMSPQTETWLRNRLAK